MKVCVIGNSHISSLKRALLLPGLSGDHQFTFFGSTRDRMLGLKVRSNVLSSADDDPLRRQMSITSGGEGVIDPSLYDVFLVYGLLLRVPPLDRRWSKAVARATCFDAYFGSVASYVVTLLCSVTKKPVLVGPVPLKASSARQPSISRDWLSDYSIGAQWIAEAVRESGGAGMVAQPPETIGDGWFTKECYSQGAVSLFGEKEVGGGDVLHMNERYGEEYLKSLVMRLKGIC